MGTPAPRVKNRIRQHYQIQRSSDADPFLLWGSLIIFAFMLFVLFLGFNALEEIPKPTEVSEVSQPEKTSRIQLKHKNSDPSNISSKRN